MVLRIQARGASGGISGAPVVYHLPAGVRAPRAPCGGAVRLSLGRPTPSAVGVAEPCTVGDTCACVARHV